VTQRRELSKPFQRFLELARDVTSTLINLARGKPLKRFTHLSMPLITGLKPGVNEMGNYSSFEAELS